MELFNTNGNKQAAARFFEYNQDLAAQARQRVAELAMQGVVTEDAVESLTPGVVYIEQPEQTTEL